MPGMGTYSTNGVTTEPRVPEAELEKETTVISTTVTRLLTKTAFWPPARRRRWVTMAESMDNLKASSVQAKSKLGEIGQRVQDSWPDATPFR